MLKNANHYIFRGPVVTKWLFLLVLHDNLNNSIQDKEYEQGLIKSPWDPKHSTVFFYAQFSNVKLRENKNI